MDGEFVIIDGEGNVLTPLREWSPDVDDAETFWSVESARSARPGHADGTARSRVVFKDQVRPFQVTGCLTGGVCYAHHH